MSTRSKHFPILFLIAIVFLIYLINVKDTGPAITENRKSRVPLFEKWHKRAVEVISKEHDPEKFWHGLQKISNKLDQYVKVHDEFNLVPLRNMDEVKYGILPKNTSKSRNILVTLGIGNDITAEKSLKSKIEAIGQKIQFYGADPILVSNQKIYQEIGTYFPFAVGGDGGYGKASVLENGQYVDKNVLYIDILYFIQNILKEKIIDYLWVDAEWAEYNMLDIFYQDGRLNRNSITFCQMSIELHSPSHEQMVQFITFIKRILDEKNFGFFYLSNVGHMRVWFFNFGSDYCIDKFLKV